MIEFGDPNALWLLWLVPLLVLFLRWRQRKRRQALERFAENTLVQRLVEGFLPHRRRWKLALLVAGIGLLCLALARPLYGQKEEIIKRQGMDIVVAMDTSDSMLAEDLRPNRLQVAKREVNRLIDILDGDRIGLVPFAGDAFVQCPLTLDYAAAKMFLDEMDTTTVSRPGTAIGRAIEIATRCFVQEEQKYKVLILITDGEDTVGSPDAREMARRAAQQGVRIYTIGVGSRQGVPIPIRDEQGQLVGYKKDQQGGKVLSRLDEPLLRDVALSTDGAYFRATTERFELDRIYDDINQLEEKELRAAVRLRGIDRFQYILLPALILILAEPFLSERRSQGGKDK
jgi:Ca-activated chloride channel family protein